MEPQTIQPKKRSTGKIVFITCSTLLLLSLLCCGIIGAITYFIVGKGLNIIKSPAAEILCSSAEGKTDTVYENNTTSNFKESMSLNNFKEETGKISQEECNNFKNSSIIDFAKNGWSVNTSTNNGNSKTKFSGKVGDNNVNIEFTSGLKVDQLTID